MTQMYRLPEVYGGHEAHLTSGPWDGKVTVMPLVDGRPTGLELTLNVEHLTAIAPAEPPLGSIIIDSGGDAWHRKDDFWWYGARMITWEQLNKEIGVAMLVGSTQPEGLPMRMDLVERIPASFTAAVGRQLYINMGKQPRQLVLQVLEGQSFGRAAILDFAEAEALAWTILASVHGGEVSDDAGV